MMILPRQARDKLWESTQKKTIVLLQFRAGETTSVRLGKTKVDTHTRLLTHKTGLTTSLSCFVVPSLSWQIVGCHTRAYLSERALHIFMSTGLR